MYLRICIIKQILCNYVIGTLLWKRSKIKNAIPAFLIINCAALNGMKIKMALEWRTKTLCRNVSQKMQKKP